MGSRICLAVTAFLLVSCFEKEIAQRSDGSWYETGNTLFFPDIKSYRGKKDMVLPASFHESLITYYKSYSIWPFTYEGLLKSAVAEPSEITEELKNNGFEITGFVNKGDTLDVYFNFYLRYKITYTQLDDDKPQLKKVKGKWQFFRDGQGYFQHAQQEVSL